MNMGYNYDCITPSLVEGLQNDTAPFGRLFVINLPKLNTGLLYVKTIVLLGIYYTGLKTYIDTKT